MVCGPMLGIVFPNAAVSIDPVIALLLLTAATFAVEVVGVLMWSRLAPLWDRRALVVGSLATVAIGTGVLAVSASGIAPFGAAGVYLGAFLVGAATPPAWWWWGELSSLLPPRLMGITVPASTIAATALLALLLWAIRVAPPATLVALLLVAVTPAVLAACASYRAPNIDALGSVGSRAPYRPSLHFLGGIFLYSAAFTMVLRAAALPGASQETPWLVAPVFSAVAVISVFVKSKHPALNSVQHLLLPVSATCLVVAPLLVAASPAPFGLVLFAYVFFQTLVLITYMYIIGRSGVSGSAVLMWGSIALYGGQLMGMGAARVVVLAEAPDACTFALAIVLCVLASTYLLSERNVATCWGVVPEQGADTPTTAQISQGAAASYGLTPREREVLELLLEGKTADDVSAELVISVATVRTHIHRIYEKVGVHSQIELIQKCR